MSQFEVHTIETAPEASRPALTGARTRYGALFNLFGVLGESPVALKAYAALGELLVLVRSGAQHEHLGPRRAPGRRVALA